MGEHRDVIEQALLARHAVMMSLPTNGHNVRILRDTGHYTGVTGATEYLEAAWFYSGRQTDARFVTVSLSAAVEAELFFIHRALESLGAV